MRNTLKYSSLVFILFFTFSLKSFATHLVGGDITVKWLNGNDFELTVQLFRDCGVGNGNFDPDIILGLYDKVTNQEIKTIWTVFNPPVISNVVLGDACYTPSLCMQKAVYKETLSIPNNPNGYYISWHRCCRNASIANIPSSGYTGYIAYCEIPDPALRNSSPTFSSIPDGYMCMGYLNSDNFSCTDIDGDLLKYSFSTPLSCSATGICDTSNVNNMTAPKPYGTISWSQSYSLANPMGDPNMSVNPSTGVVTTRPPSSGIYVFCVKVEEFRAGVKIGEIQRDFQFDVLSNCQILNVQNSPANGNGICLGETQTLSANSMGAGFIYSWNPGGQTTRSITVTPATNGVFNYTVTAANGACKYEALATVTVNANPTQSYVTANNVLCNGGVGSAIATPLGGATPYTYQWLTAPIQTGSTAVGLAVGTYSVIVKDANSCVSTETITITQPTSLSTTTSTTPAGCNLAIGSASAFPSGGTAPYLYSWNTSPIQSTKTATGLMSGNYTVIIKDANDCPLTANVNVPVANGPSVTATVVSNAGCNSAIGVATASPIGGTPPYSYLWTSTPAQTTQTAIGLYSGNYNIIIKDANACSQTASVYVPVANGPSVTPTITSNILCNGNSNGSISVSSTLGGLPPYTYLWNTTPVQTTSIATGLSANVLYTAIVTDANNCSSSNSVMLSQPALLQIASSFTMPSCFGYSDGDATTVATGGTIGNGYKFFWSTSPLQTTAKATGLVAGNYSVTVLDVKGCIATHVVSVTEPTQIILTTSLSGFSCAGISPNGKATVSVVGGSPGYYYMWKPGNKTTPTISNIIAGIYSVTVTDSKGCSNSKTATILPSTKPHAQFSTKYTLSCKEVTINFIDESTPSSITSWSWNFGDSKLSAEQNPSHSFPYDVAKYSVTLIVSNPPCFDTIITNIKVGDMLTYSSFDDANFFSPNGDAKNDVFRPVMAGVGAAALKECISLKVYDRWGVKVFESESLNNGWDGNDYKNNKPVADGVYFYESTLGKTIIRGYVTLLRN
jgi:gliding motility-associated-like protein